MRQENMKFGENAHFAKFTWSEYVQVAADQGRNMGGGGDKWAGGSWDDALAMATSGGYQDAIPEAMALVDQITTDMDEFMSDSFVTTFDVAGAEVDMGRFMAGEPECMRESTPLKVMRTGRVLKVLVPVCYSAMIGQAVVRRRGAAVMALVEAFARLQHPMEIWAGIAVHVGFGGQGRCVTMVKVQDADQPLDMGRVMYALAHPTMLRQLGFAVEDSYPEEIARKFGFRGHGSYGGPNYSLKSEDAEINSENAIILPQLDPSDTWTEEFSVAWIKEEIKRVTES